MVPSRKIPVTYERIDEDLLGFFLCLCGWSMETSVVMATFFMYVSLIHGDFCCSGHILYICVADPWKLLFQWSHSLCTCRWSMETSVVVATFFMFVSLIHGNFCSSGHILYACVADPWKLPLYWPHSLCLCRWSVENSVVVATFFVCVADPWKLLFQWSHSLCMCRWSMETSVVLATFFMFVSLIRGNFCCSGHIHQSSKWITPCFISQRPT